MIDRNDIDRIFEAVRIVEVVEEFVQLKRRGVNFIGCCPFHNERTPSFIVSPAKNIYKCFGCGKAGNAVNFVMEHEQLGYPEALRFLAKKYGIEISEKELTPEERQQSDRRESLMVVSAYAARIFQENLHNTREGMAIGMSYFKERSFREDIIRKFELGYSLEARNAFVQKALKDGYKEEFLVNAGLCINGEKGLFDRFAGRVMFPIHSLSGKVIAFGGRVLKTDKNKHIAKYVNSPESEIYHKSNVLYGIFQAKNSIVRHRKCFLVEGYTDVISMHQAGIENVVASSGTALTTEQIRLIKRFAENVTVLYDGDAAGIKAALRGIDMFLQEGMNVKALLLPDGDDPDSFSRKHSAVALEEYFSHNETDFIRFKAKLLLDDAQGDPIRHASLINEVMHSIAVIPDPIKRAVYLKEAAEMFGMDEQMLAQSADEKRKKLFKEQRRRTEEKPVVEDTRDKEMECAEQEIIRLLIIYGNEKLFDVDEETGTDEVSVAGYLTEELRTDELEPQQPVLRAIFEEYEQQLKASGRVDDKFFILHPNPEVSSVVADLITAKYKLSSIHEHNGIQVKTEMDQLCEIVPVHLLAYKQKKIIRLLEERFISMQKALEAKDLETYDQCYAQYTALTEIKKVIAKNLGNRVLC
ncbi:MAG: DNA primase [Bacteroidales bacterium]|nr:DNA primase [Bacteroidales bacterium]